MPGSQSLDPPSSSDTAASADFARLVRDSLTSLGTSVVFFAVTYVASIVFARILSPQDYGDYAIGMTTLSLGSMTALAGSGHAMTRYLPAYLERKDYAHLSGYIRFFVPLVVAGALLIGAGVWVVREVAAAAALTGEVDALRPIVVAAFVIGFYALATFGNRLLRSFDLMVASFIPTRLLAPLASLALVVGLHLAGITVTDWLVIAAVGAGFALAILFEIVVFIAHGHHKLLAHKPAYEIGTWLGVSFSLMTGGLLSELLHHGDLVMLELVSANEDVVGLYAAINNTVVVLSLVAAAVVIVTTPRLGAAIGRRAPAEIQALLGDATALTFLGSVAATAAILVFRQPLLGLFGPSYIDAAPALAIASVAYGVSAAFGVCRTYLQFLGYHRAALWPMAVGILLNLMLNAALIPPLGIDGAALATLVSLVAIRAVQIALLYRLTGLVVLPFRRRLSVRAQHLGLPLEPDA